MAIDYSAESALPMAQGGDIVDVAALRLLRDALAGRVVTVTTSGSLPAVASAGHPAYLSDIEAIAIKGPAWRYVDLIPQTQAGVALTCGGNATTLGTGGAIWARYMRLGRAVRWWGRVNFGTGVSFGAGGSLQLNYPVSLDLSVGAPVTQGHVLIVAATAAPVAMAQAVPESTTRTNLYLPAVSGANLQWAAATNTSTPAGTAWGAGGEIRWDITYTGV